MPDTHLVTNQVPPLADWNPATSPVLIEALIREGGQWGLDEVSELGAISGGATAQRWGDLADRNRPVLHTHDRYGYRVDEIEYDPAYHELMRIAISHGLHAAPWADDRPGAHVVRAAKMGVWEMTPGVMRDVEADEVFVVLSGAATVQFADGTAPLTLKPGDVVRLAEGTETVWTVTERLRKVYLT